MVNSRILTHGQIESEQFFLQAEGVQRPHRAGLGELQSGGHAAALEAPECASLGVPVAFCGYMGSQNETTRNWTAGFLVLISTYQGSILGAYF